MGFKYIGNGSFIPGIPARDLTDEEIEDRGILADVQASDLYEASDTQVTRRRRSAGAGDNEQGES